MLFGKNPNSEILKSMLELGTKYRIGRFRDIYIKDDEGELIIILYTRNGGGNRDCWEYEGCDYAKDIHDEECMISIIEKLQQHPYYIRDYDDDFDRTYAYFEFKIPDEYKELAKLLAGEAEPTVTEKFNTLINEMKTMNKEQIEKDERFKPFIEILSKLNIKKE